MKVRELIEKLQGCDQELDVFTYDQTSEEGSRARKVVETDEVFPYCKGDPPRGYVEGKSYVLIDCAQ